MRPLLSWNSHFCVSHVAECDKEHPFHVGNCFGLLRVLPFLFFSWCHVSWMGVILFFLVLVQFWSWIYCHRGRPSLLPCRDHFLLMIILHVITFFLALTFVKFICTSAFSSHELNISLMAKEMVLSRMRTNMYGAVLAGVVGSRELPYCCRGCDHFVLLWEVWEVGWE